MKDESDMESRSWEILQVFNNNVVLAVPQNAHDMQQAILVGRGIGFAAERGDTVNPDHIQEVFTPQTAASTEHFTTMLSELPAELLGLARELAELASLLCGIKITDSFVIMLADHINAAVDRATRGVDLPNPMQWDTRQFYPREYEFGIRALVAIKQATGIQLYESERTAIAQHAVNAKYASGFASDEIGLDSFATTVKLTG